MKYQELINTIFGDSAKIVCSNDIITGEAICGGRKSAVCGIVNEAALDNQMSVRLASFILDVISIGDKRPIFLLVDTSGQKVSRHAELLGLNFYYGHLIKTFHLARSLGHRVFALVYGKALGGSFIATGLNADYIFALPDASIAVMWLDAMSRVTKIPIEKLTELSKSSPIFAPGAENFVKLGAVDAITRPEEFVPRCLELLDKEPSIHHRRIQGAKAGGRILAQKIVEHVIEA